VSSLFRRRAFNIESLTVGRTNIDGVSRMTVILETDDHTVRRVQGNLYKLVNVLLVEDITHTPKIERDLALIKVRANTEARAQIMQLCEVFRSRVVDVSIDAVVVEITGTEDKIQGLLDVLAPFGIIEMVRTGGIAITRGSEGPELDLDQTLERAS